VGIKPFASWVTSPIEITAVRVRGKEVRVGRPFASEDNWIRHLSVTVKNVSEIDIVGVTVSVEFGSDPDETPWLPEVELQAGTDYSFSRSIPTKDFSLRPGESTELSVSESAYAAHLYSLGMRDDLPIGVNRRAQIKPEMAAFNEDRIWLRGRFLLRDPENPNRWVKDEEGNKAAWTKLRQIRMANFDVRKVKYSRSSLPGCYTGKMLVSCCVLLLIAPPARSQKMTYATPQLKGGSD
jgi:hypothetical protein